MASVSAFLNADPVRALAASGARHMQRELSLGVRDCLVLIERNHKTKQIRRSSKSGAKPIADKWTTRDGDLVKSFHRDWSPGKLVGAYGSDLERAAKVEQGGEIRPKGRFLAIPTQHAPKKVWPRHVPDLVYLQSLKGQPLLVKPTGGNSFLVMYVLRRKVKLPPRPALDRAVVATREARDKRMAEAVDRALGAGKKGGK